MCDVLVMLGLYSHTCQLEQRQSEPLDDPVCPYIQSTSRGPTTSRLLLWLHMEQLAVQTQGTQGLRRCTRLLQPLSPLIRFYGNGRDSGEGEGGAPITLVALHPELFEWSNVFFGLSIKIASRQHRPWRGKCSLGNSSRSCRVRSGGPDVFQRHPIWKYPRPVPVRLTKVHMTTTSYVGHVSM